MSSKCTRGKPQNTGLPVEGANTNKCKLWASFGTGMCRLSVCHLSVARSKVHNPNKHGGKVPEGDYMKCAVILTTNELIQNQIRLVHLTE